MGGCGVERTKQKAHIHTRMTRTRKYDFFVLVEQELFFFYFFFLTLEEEKTLESLLPCRTLIDVPFIDALDWFLPFYTDMRAPLHHPLPWSLVQYVRRCLVPRLLVIIFITGGR